MSRVPAPSSDVDRAKGGGSKASGAPSIGLPRIRNLSTILILGIILAYIVTEILTGKAWTLLLVQPVVNALVLLDLAVFGQFGLAILLFTLILRVVTLPLTIRSFRSMKEMQAIQPLMQEINKKYKDPKRRQEETMKLYREHKINPLGCILPMVIQFVPFIVLSRALRSIVGGSPESLLSLSHELYHVPILQRAIPLDQHFLWMDLGRPDTTFIIPILVAAATYVQQRVSITPGAGASAQQQQQQQMMLWMMPMMMVFFTLNLPSGVGVYWVASNVFSLFASWRVYGRDFHWKTILSLPGPVTPANAPPKKAAPKPQPEPSNEETEEPASPQRARSTHGQRRGKRKNRR